MGDHVPAPRSRYHISRYRLEVRIKTGYLVSLTCKATKCLYKPRTYPYKYYYLQQDKKWDYE